MDDSNYRELRGDNGSAWYIVGHEEVLVPYDPKSPIASDASTVSTASGVSTAFTASGVPNVSDAPYSGIRPPEQVEYEDFKVTDGKDITGVEFEQLFSYLDENIPVIVWGTVDCEEPVNRTTWVVDGKELRWYSPEHCMVLVGYGDTQVTVADPLKGALVSFDRETFKSRFYALFQQAIVIK